MLISLFPAPFDHFYFHPTLGLKWIHYLRLGLRTTYQVLLVWFAARTKYQGFAANKDLKDRVRKLPCHCQLPIGLSLHTNQTVCMLFISFHQPQSMLCIFVVLFFTFKSSMCSMRTAHAHFRILSSSKNCFWSRAILLLISEISATKNFSCFRSSLILIWSWLQDTRFSLINQSQHENTPPVFVSIKIVSPNRDDFIRYIYRLIDV